MPKVKHIGSDFEELKITEVDDFVYIIPEGNISLRINRKFELVISDRFNNQPAVKIIKSIGKNFTKNPHMEIVNTKSLNFLGLSSYDRTIFIFWNSHRMGLILIDPEDGYVDNQETKFKLEELVQYNLIPSKIVFLFIKRGE